MVTRYALLLKTSRENRSQNLWRVRSVRSGDISIWCLKKSSQYCSNCRHQQIGTIVSRFRPKFRFTERKPRKSGQFRTNARLRLRHENYNNIIACIKYVEIACFLGKVVFSYLRTPPRRWPERDVVSIVLSDAKSELLVSSRWRGPLARL